MHDVEKGDVHLGIAPMTEWAKMGQETNAVGTHFSGEICVSNVASGVA